MYSLKTIAISGVSIGVITFLCLLFFMRSSYWAPRIDEKYAAAMVKDKLSLSGNVSAQKLGGGFGSTLKFLVTDGLKKYSIRFITNRSQQDREWEIYNFKIASDEGYGPQVYFVDLSRGIIIMEYLSDKKISSQDLQSDQFYVALAHLLQKIHHGQAFKDQGYDVFKKISKAIKINEPKYSNYVPLAKVQQIITVIHRALLPHLTIAPCHNDLHGGNLIFLGNKFKAIDYGDAGLGDPYFDVATVVASFSPDVAHEKLLLETYLGRQPSATEAAKLYLMKQVILIKWAFDALYRLRSSPEIVHQYGVIKAPAFVDWVRKYFEGKIDLSKSETNLGLLKALLNQVFDNFESQKFHNAVNLVSK